MPETTLAKANTPSHNFAPAELSLLGPYYISHLSLLRCLECGCKIERPINKLRYMCIQLPMLVAERKQLQYCMTAAKLRSSSWWIRYFVQTGLEENESAIKKFEQAAEKKTDKPSCQVFHLSSYH